MSLYQHLTFPPEIMVLQTELAEYNPFADQHHFLLQEKNLINIHTGACVMNSWCVFLYVSDHAWTKIELMCLF